MITAAPWLAISFRLSRPQPCTPHSPCARGIWRKDDPRWNICGIPDVLYTDHGSDFTSRHLEQVSADLKIRLIFSTPGKPRGRGRIERFFSSVDEMFLCELDGYAPAGGRARGKARLTLAELDSRLRTFLLDVYHRRKCAETKAPPAERWEANGFLPRMPESLEQLDLLLVQVAKTRRVHRDGIHFHGLRYISPTLAAYVGESVTIRFDPRDMGEIRVFHGEGFLCRAISAELAGETVPLRDIIRARNRRRRELRAVLRDRQQTVETLLQIKRGKLTETEDAKTSSPTKAAEPTLKRYRNE